jgi:hypothetical protein
MGNVGNVCSCKNRDEMQEMYMVMNKIKIVVK